MGSEKDKQTLHFWFEGEAGNRRAVVECGDFEGITFHGRHLQEAFARFTDFLAIDITGEWGKRDA